MYGINVGDSCVSKITDKILPLIKEWQKRPLQSVYAIIILDAIHYNVRDNGIVTKKAAYVAIGTDLEGRKDALGIWIDANESAKYWLSVLNGSKNLGVSDILIASVDRLIEFVESINTAFPKTEVQCSIIHQIRSSSQYISCKDIKQFTSDLKPVYKAPTEIALVALDEFEAKWGKKNGVSTGMNFPPCSNIRRKSVS